LGDVVEPGKNVAVPAGFSAADDSDENGGMGLGVGEQEGARCLTFGGVGAAHRFEQVENGLPAGAGLERGEGDEEDCEGEKGGENGWEFGRERGGRLRRRIRGGQRWGAGRHGACCGRSGHGR
jgi:hypothetical protein